MFPVGEKHRRVQKERRGHSKVDNEQASLSPRCSWETDATSRLQEKGGVCENSRTGFFSSNPWLEWIPSGQKDTLFWLLFGTFPILIGSCRTPRSEAGVLIKWNYILIKRLASLFKMDAVLWVWNTHNQKDRTPRTPRVNIIGKSPRKNTFSFE